MYLPKESVSVEKVVCSGSRHLERIGSLWRFLDIQVSKEKLLTRTTHPQPLSIPCCKIFQQAMGVQNISLLPKWPRMCYSAFNLPLMFYSLLHIV